jgi:hypothetical protein
MSAGTGKGGGCAHDERRQEEKARTQVKACLNIAASRGAADALAQRGIQLEFAREAFARYALEHAAVISF